MSAIQSFEDLEAYQKCRAFRIFIFENILPLILQKKEFSLADQIKRAARSVTNNIAEGYGRYHYRDNYKFCSNARGSLCETLEHAICAADEKIIPPTLLAEVRASYAPASNILNGYMAYLAKTASTKVPNNK